MIPKLGQKVYILYGTFLLCETVELLGKDSFATPYMFSSLTRDEYRLPIMFNEYGEGWFSSLAEVKKYLEKYGEKLVKIDNDYWQVETDWKANDK